MTPQLALFACYLFILWLLAKDVKGRPGISKAIWIPLFWVVILGSRPVSLWFGNSGQAIANVEDGSPMDRMVFQLLMGLGLIVLFKRRVNLRRVIAENKWVFIYFLYLGISVLWSDYSFVSFKRWIKDLGNVVMALVILSEMNPAEAVKAVFVRCAYILVPLSVLFIKYFPDVGRYYNRWTWTYSYGGVTTDKNMLGVTLVVCGIFLLWRLLEVFDGRVSVMGKKKEVMICGALLAMTAWLSSMANSATSQACTFLGASILIILKVQPIRRKIPALKAFSIPLAVLAAFLYFGLSMGNVGTSALGRDSTFTGRTEIWQRVLKEDTNPLIGVGFYSFWLGDRAEKISAGFYFHLNESHNGYIETYLNSGLIGIFLLFSMMAAAALRLRREMAPGLDYEILRAVFLPVVAIYNVTEAAFNRMDLLWICLLLACIKYPASLHRAKRQGEDASLNTTEHFVSQDVAAYQLTPARSLFVDSKEIGCPCFNFG